VWRPAAITTSDAPPAPPRGGFFLQGMLVLLSNPKALLFFGAFIPQFVDLKSNQLGQVAILGFTFMVFASLTDAGYALLAGRARALMSAKRTRLLSRVSGGFMIGGGLWLALTRSR
jgi:threonine/homoserine/homoserine lactone efflux protein